ncbi:unnamed protein product [Caretta caretta]
MPTNKSPGMDGLNMVFYRVYWDILGSDLVIIWAESLQSGVLPLSCRRAVLALLLKKGDLHDLWNWCPVSLLSTDYKVVAKAISLRRGSVLADVVHPEQTYTVPGQTIFDNLYLVRDILELGCRDGLSFALLNLDQQKAFNRAQLDLTEPVSVGQGVQQGCPLSGQLYALAIEPFLHLLRRKLKGLALWETELWLVLSVYDDDVLLVVQDLDNLVQVEACQAIYSAASSARVNWVKSSGLVIGDGWQASALPPKLQAIRWSTGLLLYLGVYLSATHPSPPENWQDLEARVSAFLGTLDPNECLVLGEDFNTILKDRERSGIKTSQAAAGILREIVDVWHDHHPDDDVTFTYVQVEEDMSCHSRLDRIYFSHSHLARAHAFGIRLALFSDHHLVTVMASLSSERPGPAYWHFNNSLLEDMGFVVSFREFWLDLDNLVQVKACQAVYSVAPSAWVNWVKSSGLVIGDGWQASSLPPKLQAIRWSAGPLLYLGVYLSATHPSPPENWQDLEARVGERLWRWTELFWCLSL